MSEERPEKPTEDVQQTPNVARESAGSHEHKATITTPSITAQSGTSDDQASSRESTPPQLPPRPEKPPLLTPTGSLRVSKALGRPKLQSHATTAISRADISIAAQGERSPSASTPKSAAQSRRSSFSRPRRFTSRAFDEADDGASIKSGISNVGSLSTALGAESLLGQVLEKDLGLPWSIEQAEEQGREEGNESDLQWDDQFESQFSSEFVELSDLKSQGNTEESLMLALSLKLKHFFILSSAGKPIWSRHGDDELISNSIGVMQTIISFYQGAEDVLKSFTAGQTRFCILSKGHLYLVAVSCMGENDTHLRAQLEALYMQILSTLTLTNMEKMFVNRPSTDLRRPLQGTEKLLAALADGFTRGSPSTLLSALECLRLRKTHRTTINNCFSKARAPNLLYGLLITDTGQLVSVLRPKKHSLHPGDLQLIFNMLFEAKSIRTGGGENWIPLCLPGFNNTGFVYMYVSFLDIGGQETKHLSARKSHDRLSPSPSRGKLPPPNLHPKEFCLVMISAQPGSFDELRNMRDSFVSSVIGSTSPATSPTKAAHTQMPLLAPLREALASPRPPVGAIAPGSPIQHFLYKSRAHVQYVQPEAPQFATAIAWRKLISRYAALHGWIHGRSGRNKVVHSTGKEGVGIAWATQAFEIYAVAPRGTKREAVAKGVENVVRWCRREEERLFVVGGAVF